VLAGELLEVDALARAAERELDAVVDEPFGVQPRGNAGLLEQRDGYLLEDAGADPAEHVFGAALLDDDGVDAGPGEQRAEQQAGRASADDRDLGSAHGAPSLVVALRGAAALCASQLAPPLTSRSMLTRSAPRRSSSSTSPPAALRFRTRCRSA